MIIRNFFEEKLAQASYLVGCAATGQAIVIDPCRDIKQYVDMARAQGLRITAVTETHIHADYLSGTRELAAATGATIYLSDEGDADWKYAFASDPSVKLLHDGDVITIGNITLTTMHTPGHTPEHLSFLLVDHPTSDFPHSFFSGDFVFVGDLGRPDLLEKAAKIAGTMEAGARTLYRSLSKLADLPDSLLIWPGHGAGSSCGKSLGGSPVTTLGYERRSNWAFRVHSEDKFVDEILSGQPEPPTYFAMMKKLNKEGPAVLNGLPCVSRVSSSVGRLVDVRSGDEVRDSLYEGALAIPSGKSFTTWAGWLLKYNEPVTLIADSQGQADTAARDMATIGLDVVSGWIHPSELDSSKFAQIKTVGVSELDGDAFVLDIRGSGERRMGGVRGSAHIILGRLPDRLAEVPRDRKVIVHCAAGGRSPIAYSILKNAGFENVWELPGGMNEIEVERPDCVCV